MKQLILASQSPRRKELLEKCGVPFICHPADVDEQISNECALTDEIVRLSKKKAEAVYKQNPQSIVIGSDTIVAIDHKPLGKPVSPAHAFEMLKMLSGHTHQVITGLCIMSSQKIYTNVSVSNVSFATLTDDEINTYINTGEPMDKAGAYAIQGEAGKFITQIDGDYYAIMGLPLQMVYNELKNIEDY